MLLIGNDSPVESLIVTTPTRMAPAAFGGAEGAAGAASAAGGAVFVSEAGALSGGAAATVPEEPISLHPGGASNSGSSSVVFSMSMTSVVVVKFPWGVVIVMV